MEDRRLPPLMEYFSEVQDPMRETKNKKYPLIEVIVIAFLAVMSGADGWESIERYGIMRGKWLGKFLALREGIPRHDVYRRVLGAIRSGLLESCFMNWVRDIKQDIQRENMEGMTVSEMAVELGINKAAVKKRLLRAGRKPFSQEALYTSDDLEAIRNVPGKGRPRKASGPEATAKSRAKKSEK